MKKILFAALLTLIACFAFAQDESLNQAPSIEEKGAEENSSKKSRHNWSITVDFAYYTKSDPVAANGERYARITGPYDGPLFGVTGAYDYTIPLVGQSALTKDNNLKLCADFQISPATLKPHAFVSCSPIAFLVFNAGVTLGTGWECLGNQGLASYNAASGKYDNLTPFKNFFYEFDVSATFQFDAAALWPGDWHHIVFMAAYDFRFSGMTSVADGNPWIWAADFPKVNGANYYANIILGYQMPKKVSLVGVQAEFEGFYSDSQIDARYRNYDIDFCRINISPLAVFSLTKKDSLFALLYFERRRGYDSAKGSVNGREQSEVEMNCSGGEWYFRRIAVRYIHKF